MTKRQIRTETRQIQSYNQMCLQYQKQPIFDRGRNFLLALIVINTHGIVVKLSVIGTNEYERPHNLIGMYAGTMHGQ